MSRGTCSRPTTRAARGTKATVAACVGRDQPERPASSIIQSVRQMSSALQIFVRSTHVGTSTLRIQRRAAIPWVRQKKKETTRKI